MSKKPTVLMILDGFGLNEKTEGNAIAQAKTPVIDGLMKDYPFVKRKEKRFRPSFIRTVIKRWCTQPHHTPVWPA